MGYLSVFDDSIKAKPGFALVFSSSNSPLPAAGSGVLPGKVVLSAV